MIIETLEKDKEDMPTIGQVYYQYQFVVNILTL